MQRFLFAKVEVWLVLVAVLFALLGMVGFGALILEQTRGEDRFGPVSEVAVAVAETPLTLVELLRPDDTMVAFRPNHVEGKSGWSAFDTEGGPPLNGYLLLSRYDGTLQRPVVEMRNLPDGEVLHIWRPDIDALLASVTRQNSVIADYTRWNTKNFRIIHPFLANNGDLIIKDHQSPLFRIDSCGEMVWKQDEHLYHHTTKSDGADGFWIPSYVEPSQIKRTAPDFHDDALAHIDGAGKVLFHKSLTEAMIKNGLFYLVFATGTGTGDPLHLNDIEPVMSDGPYWKKGDLFLSLRTPSMVMLYRPSTNKIVWSKQGPWMRQHDVDIIDDHTIGIFNNNGYDAGAGPYIRGVSEILYYDFATDEVTSPFRDALEEQNFQTYFEGLFTLLPSGHLFLEEENSGRIIILSPHSKLAVEFVNRAEDGRVYRLGWSRYIEKVKGDAILEKIGSVECETR